MVKRRSVRFVKLVTGITFGPTDETSEGGYISGRGE